MIPKRIHQIWLGGPMPLQCAVDVNNLKGLNPTWEHTLWDEEKLASIGFNALRSYDDLGSWAAVSNSFRLLLLSRYGGIYLDVDFEPLKPLRGLPDEGAIAALQDDTRICNAFMGARPDHPWIRWQIRHFTDFDQRDPASGVYLATAAPREDLTLIDPVLVYPYKHDTPIHQRIVDSNSILVHHWAGSWVK